MPKKFTPAQSYTIISLMLYNLIENFPESNANHDWVGLCLLLTDVFNRDVPGDQMIDLDYIPTINQFRPEITEDSGYWWDRYDTDVRLTALLFALYQIEDELFNP